MKVLVADKLEKSALDGLASLGCEVSNSPELDETTVGGALAEGGHEVLIVRSTKVNASAIKGSVLRLVLRAGAGYNTIDVDAATEHGVWVANCPGKNAVAVAELAFGLLLSLDRSIPDNVYELRAHKWNKKKFSKGRGLYGRTLGLVGFGSIGREMVPRALAFGMEVLVFSSHLAADEARSLGVSVATSLDELARLSDAVSVHVSMRPETKGMLGASFFGAMKQGAYFVNTSRGEVVVQADLIKALESGKITAGLDVFDGEPTSPESQYEGDLLDVPGLYVTHHIGASTEQAQEAVAAETVRIVDELMKTGVPPNAVNEPATRARA